MSMGVKLFEKCSGKRMLYFLIVFVVREEHNGHPYGGSVSRTAPVFWWLPPLEDRAFDVSCPFEGVGGCDFLVAHGWRQWSC